MGAPLREDEAWGGEVPHPGLSGGGYRKLGLRPYSRLGTEPPFPQEG